MANKITLIFQLFLKRKYDVLEAAIRMGDRLAGGITCCSQGLCVNSFADHPLTEPCSSARMIWRWNSTKMTRVGTRIRIVPAHSRGISVA